MSASAPVPRVRRRWPRSNGKAAKTASTLWRGIVYGAADGRDAERGRSPHARPRSQLLQRLQVGDKRVQVARGDDPSPVRHADDRLFADHTARADEGNDLRVGVEL